jgi:hypothetical protein
LPTYSDAWRPPLAAGRRARLGHRVCRRRPLPTTATTMPTAAATARIGCIRGPSTTPSMPSTCSERRRERGGHRYLGAGGGGSRPGSPSWTALVSGHLVIIYSEDACRPGHRDLVPAIPEAGGRHGRRHHQDASHDPQPGDGSPAPYRSHHLTLRPALGRPSVRRGAHQDTGAVHARNERRVDRREPPHRSDLHDG